MDLQLFLTLGMMSYAAVVGFMTLVNGRPDGWSWLLVSGAAVLVGLSGLALAPDWAATLTALVVVPFLVVPTLLMRITQNRMMMSRWRRAADAARLLASLHPSRRARFDAAVAEAIALAEETGSTLGLHEVLRATGNRPEAAVIEPLILSREDRWADVATATAETAAVSPDALVLRIRALGEIGRLDDMAATIEINRDRLAGIGLPYGELFALAFLGRRDAVDELLAGPLAMLDAETQAYWRGIAQAHDSDPTVAVGGREALAAIAQTSRRLSTRLAAARHAAKSGAAPAPLAPQTATIAKALSEAVHRRAADIRARPARLVDMPLTVVIIGANLAMFTASVALGGAEDIATLVELGALWPPYVVEAGEWWRLVTSAFLHFGPLHLIANMLALMVFGRIIEATYGTLRMGAVYGLGALVSSGLVLTLMLADGPDANNVYLGASGAIFALFGAEVARNLKAWRLHRDASDRRHLILLAFVMGLQTLVDLSVPEISLTAHLSGFVTGLLLGALLAVRADVSRPIAPPSPRA